MEMIKGERTTLRQLGLDEKWLQKAIAQDPSMLGLGELFLIERERKQATGGKIDLIMLDQKEGIQYTVEVMLGSLDESHIIRTIEYWDIERMRFRQLEHRAVIIAEDITSRFFNVIWLLNRAVPIIAIQLQAIKLDQKLLLNFTKVLDITELSEQESTPINDREVTNREYWEKRAGSLIAVVDKIVGFVPTTSGPPRVAYNKGHIALGTTSKNFAWFHPRKNSWLVQFLLEKDQQKTWLAQLSDKQINATAEEWEISVRLTQEQLANNDALISGLLRASEAYSRS